MALRYKECNIIQYASDQGHYRTWNLLFQINLIFIVLPSFEIIPVSSYYLNTLNIVNLHSILFVIIPVFVDLICCLLFLQVLVHG